jgi:DNA/RNA-binding domain of Phe-tRNA-synthetase-like protein
MKGLAMLEINVADAVKLRWSGEVALAVCQLDGCDNVTSLGSRFDAEHAEVVDQLRVQGKSLLEEERPKRMRATFRAMLDMDPSRYRPASEALIRRCLEKGLFRINPLVDVNNLTSVKLRMPLGIYDLARVPSCSWVYRLGNVGETYKTLSGQEKNADGKLVLADMHGVVGSPVVDSGRAAVHPETSRVAVIAFLPCGTSRSEGAQVAEQIEHAFSSHIQFNTCARHITEV